jgi:hypothetical protein
MSFHEEQPIVTGAWERNLYHTHKLKHDIVCYSEIVQKCKHLRATVTNAVDAYDDVKRGDLVGCCREHSFGMPSQRYASLTFKDYIFFEMS